MISPSYLITRILLIGFFSISVKSAYSRVAIPASKTEKNDTLAQVNIQGRILIKNRRVNERYKVEVLFYDNVINSYTVKNNKSLTLHLKRNSPYVIRISKKGCIQRLICLNTGLCENRRKGGDYTFYFETDLIEAKQAMCLDSEALQLPIALIAFDKKTGDFNNNNDYTSFINQKIYGVN